MRSAFYKKMLGSDSSEHFRYSEYLLHYYGIGLYDDTLSVFFDGFRYVE